MRGVMQHQDGRVVVGANFAVLPAACTLGELEE